MNFSSVEMNNLELLLKFSRTRKTLSATWMIRDALSYRVVFIYPDKTLLTVSAENEIWLQAEMESSTKPDDKWITKSQNGEFKLAPRDDTPSSVLMSEMGQRGKPKLVLPWEDWDQVVDEMGNSEEEDVGLLIQAFSDQILTGGSDYPWESCEFTYGEDCLPKDCDYSRFESLVKELDERNWIVIWDECCGVCAGGNISDERDSDPSKADSPAFVIYGQNADLYFYPDGSIKNFMFSVDDKGEGLELLLAAKYGFNYVPTEDYAGVYVLNPSGKS